MFPYLKRSSALPEVLALPNEMRLPSVVYLDGMDAATECDLAVLHAGAGAFFI